MAKWSNDEARLRGECKTDSEKKYAADVLQWLSRKGFGVVRLRPVTARECEVGLVRADLEKGMRKPRPAAR